LNFRQNLHPVYRIILILSVTLVSVSIAFGGEDQLMPRWFWETPEVDGIRFAVGFAQSYVRNMESSYEEAFSDAIRRLYIDHGCRVKGERAQGSGSTGTFSLGEIADFRIDESGLESFANSVTHLDSVHRGKFVAVLVATDPVNLDKELAHSPTVQEARKCIEDSDFIACGSGTCRTSYYQNLSWLEAERAARVEAAYSIHSEVNHYRQKMDAQMVDVTVNKTDVRIANFRTVGRALDKENKQVWVFVEAIREP